MSKLFAASLVVLLAGCSMRDYTPIGQLTSTPERFADREIQVHGQVVDIIKLPVMDFAVYTIRDNTGQIYVLTRHPPTVSKVARTVTGRLETLAAVGGQNIGLHLVETQSR